MGDSPPPKWIIIQINYKNQDLLVISLKRVASFSPGRVLLTLFLSLCANRLPNQGSAPANLIFFCADVAPAMGAMTVTSVRLVEWPELQPILL